MRESMKKLLATSAIALVALSGAASAQSVLERVLGQIDNATNLASVNGTFANIAENIGTSGTTTETVYINNGNVISQAEADVIIQANTVTAEYTAGDGANTSTTDDTYYRLSTGEVLTEAEFDALSSSEQALFTLLSGTQVLLEKGDGTLIVEDDATDANATRTTLNGNITTLLATADTVVVETGDMTGGINGSITNTLDGIDQATQQAIASSSVSAIEWNMPTFDFGDMATTALGAVNTGDITLGVNSAIDEASTSTTNAISAVIDQLGGSADTGAIILNVASNMTAVNGSITNTMNEVNGSIGNLSTTALGAVNTGTIVSGVDAAVAGIVGSSTGGSNGL
jgi:hypothetical protein